MQKEVKQLLSWLFPAQCVGCGRRGGELLCERCRESIVPIEFHCTRCAEPLPSGFHHLCGGCITKELEIDYAITCYPYQGALRESLISLKSKNRPALWRGLRRLLIQALELRKEQGVLAPFFEADLVVPIPLHWRRLWVREFNQAHWIAREVGRFLGLPVELGLRRVRPTPQQWGRSFDERRRNVEGAFEAVRPFSGKRAIIVDDIATSLATANEAAKVLKRTGAPWVGLFTLARTLRIQG